MDIWKSVKTGILYFSDYRRIEKKVSLEKSTSFVIIYECLWKVTSLRLFFCWLAERKTGEDSRGSAKSSQPEAARNGQTGQHWETGESK